MFNLKENICKDMKLTIITVNYNDACGLKRTLQSVKEQTSQDFEYLVIDGGSQDGSKDLLDEYNEIITYSVSERDSGVFNAMNKGIGLAKGNYCLFLNAGDYFAANDVVEKVLPTLDDTDFISGDTICINPSGKKALWKAPRILSVYVITRYSLSHQSTFIKTSLLKKRPYREDLRIASDWEQELYELVFHDATYKSVPINVCYFYEDGISRTDINGVKAERNKVYSEYFSKRLLHEILGSNELKVIVNHAEESSSLYKYLLLGSKIMRKLYYLFHSK